MNNEENKNGIPNNMQGNQPTYNPVDMPNLNPGVNPNPVQMPNQQPSVNPNPAQMPSQQPSVTPNPAQMPNQQPSVNPNTVQMPNQNTNSIGVQPEIVPEAPEVLQTSTPEPVFGPVNEPAPTQPTNLGAPEVNAQPALEPVTEVSPLEQNTNQDPAVQLEKKVVVEDTGKKKGNPIIGFIALLLVLAVIVVAFYYFISEGIIKSPWSVNEPSTTIPTTEPTTEPVTMPIATIDGLYRQVDAELFACPEQPLALTLNSDNSFVFNDLSYNPETEICSNYEKTGTYTEVDDTIHLVQENGEEVIINFVRDDSNIVLNIMNENNTVELHKVAQ